LRIPRLTKKAQYGLLLVAPAFALLFLVYIYPLVFNVDLSLSRWILGRVDKYYIGLGNYELHFSDPLFYRVLANTFFFTAVSVPLEFFIGLGLALLLSKAIKGRSIFLAVLLLPMMIAPVIVGLAWRWLYAWDYGALNPILGMLGVGPIAWLGDPSIAMYSVIIADAWCTIPFMILFAFSGIQMIPNERYEAARVNGASSWQMFKYVTFPSIKGILSMALIIRAMDAFTKLFDVAYVLTGGGPGYATEVLPIYTYRIGLKFFRLGSGAAVGLITLFFAAIMIMVIMKAWRR